MFALLFSNRVIHVPQKDRALYTALINTFCAVLMGMAALELAIKPQGRRMKSSSQQSEHVLIVPGGLLATGPHADPGCSATAHEVDGDFAQNGQIAGRCQ